MRRRVQGEALSKGRILRGGPPQRSHLHPLGCVGAEEAGNWRRGDGAGSSMELKA